MVTQRPLDSKQGCKKDFRLMLGADFFFQLRPDCDARSFRRCSFLHFGFEAVRAKVSCFSLCWNGCWNVFAWLLECSFARISFVLSVFQLWQTELPAMAQNR